MESFSSMKGRFLEHSPFTSGKGIEAHGVAERFGWGYHRTCQMFVEMDWRLVDIEGKRYFFEPHSFEVFKESMKAFLQ